MMLRLQPQRVEAGRLLAWLGAVLKKCEAVSVDIVIVDEPNRSSSVQITLRDVPGPLAGVEVRSGRGG